MLRDFTRVPSSAESEVVSVSCLESLVRRTFLLKFGRRLHPHKDLPCFRQHERIHHEGHAILNHVLCDKRGLEGFPYFSHREERMPLHEFLNFYWDLEQV